MEYRGEENLGHEVRDLGVDSTKVVQIKDRLKKLNS